MPELHELSTLIRSKNAGPFHVTFDIFVRDPEVYREMKERNAVTARTFADIYGVEEGDVTFIEYDEASAFKATIPRLHSSGSAKDGDVMGGQQHSPLVGLEIDLGE